MNTHIFIPTHGRPAFLGKLLADLAVARRPINESVLVWVLENGFRAEEMYIPPTGSTGVEFTYRYYEEGNKSLTLNKALKEVKEEDFIIFLDDDIRLRNDKFIVNYLEAALQFGPGHYFGGSVFPDYETSPDPALLPYLPASSLPFDLSDGQAANVFGKYTMFLGANWACFVADLRGVSGFNAGYGPGSLGGARGQESDAQHRLADAGITPVFIADTGVNHHVPAHTVREEWVIQRIFHSLFGVGRLNPSLYHTFGLLIKFIYSLLLWPFSRKRIGHRYRIAKAAGYFYGMSLGFLRK